MHPGAGLKEGRGLALALAHPVQRVQLGKGLPHLRQRRQRPRTRLALAPDVQHFAANLNNQCSHKTPSPQTCFSLLLLYLELGPLLFDGRQKGTLFPHVAGHQVVLVLLGQRRGALLHLNRRQPQVGPQPRKQGKAQRLALGSQMLLARPLPQPRGQALLRLGAALGHKAAAPAAPRAQGRAHVALAGPGSGEKPLAPQRVLRGDGHAKGAARLQERAQVARRQQRQHHAANRMVQASEKRAQACHADFLGHDEMHVLALRSRAAPLPG